MNVNKTSQERLNGSRLSNGSYLVVEFDDDMDPCAWLQSDTTMRIDP